MLRDSPRMRLELTGWRSVSALAYHDGDDPTLTVTAADVAPGASLRRDGIIDDIDERPLSERRDGRCREGRSRAHVHPGSVRGDDDVGWRRRR